MANQDPEVPIPPIAFAGYGRPRFTQTPNLFFDAQMQDLNLSEIRVLLYIFRRTFGFQQDGAEITLSHFLKGWQARDGKRLDRGAGVAENSLLQALRSLETRGFIFRHRRSAPLNGSLTTYYELNIDGQPHCTPECASDCAPSRKTDGTPSRKTDGTPSHPQDGPPPRKTDGTLSIDERKTPKESIPPPTPDRVDRHIPLAQPTKAVVEEESDQVTRDTRLLVTFGLDAETAREIALQAKANGRLAGYVEEQVAYVQSSPGIEDPAAVLIANVRKNVRRQPIAARRGTPSAPPSPSDTRRLPPAGRESTERRTLVADPATAAQHAAASAEAARIWKTAELCLRVTVPTDEYTRLIRYARLLEIDEASGWALLGLPSEQMRKEVEIRLRDVIAAVLSQTCRRAIQLLISTLPGQGPQAGTIPTLARLLAERTPPVDPHQTAPESAQDGPGATDGPGGGLRCSIPREVTAQAVRSQEIA